MELENKDITDILIEDKAEVENEGLEEHEPQGDHPALALLDIAISQAVEYCRKNSIPEPNQSIYNDFSRPFLNKALWHYLPSGELPDDPRIALLLGVAGLGFACLPTILHFWRREKAKVVAEKPEQKVEQKAEQKAEERKEVKAEETQQSQLNQLNPILEKVKARMQT